MAPHEFNVVREGLATTEELDSVFASFLSSPGWREMETRTSRRLCDQYTFDGGRDSPPPPHLAFAHGLVQRLMGRVQQGLVDDEVVPMSLFCNLYEDGEDSCPSHVHDCRQLTMSLGAERTLTVEGRPVCMRHGDVVILDGERHGVPRQPGGAMPRVSINLFFTTARDLASREVSVNHQAGGAYGRGRGRGRGLGAAPRGSGGGAPAGAAEEPPAPEEPPRAAAARGRWRGGGGRGAARAAGGGGAPGGGRAAAA